MRACAVTVPPGSQRSAVTGRRDAAARWLSGRLESRLQGRCAAHGGASRSRSPGSAWISSPGGHIGRARPPPRPRLIAISTFFRPARGARAPLAIPKSTGSTRSTVSTLSTVSTMLFAEIRANAGSPPSHCRHFKQLRFSVALFGRDSRFRLQLERQAVIG